MSEISLDNFDYAILRILQKDNKTSHREISEKIGLSAASVQRRISRMEEKEIILRNCAILNPLKFGEKITSIIEVRLSEDRSVVMDRAKLYFAFVEEIQQCYFVNGGVSFIIIMLSNNLSHFESLVRKHFADNEDVKTYRTLIVLDRVKVNFELNI
ncbi:Lrp/AsnC family transcriptional regulator [Acinetobacter nosocomialis]|uniref:Lrp/AsnC family transcriptional regulator n=1 Tax=Acinetobacter nosocomialis TaxID=106654 RepID=UPI000B3D9BB3|nr:Lrp/AsnC family transcriptional regulator [Acinetobacter nosocomialis]MBD0443991.1 Lrp/AsnC family transcriptional regulator [Acinetobacter nosocomialis]MDQ9039500.1 Lrp/AsnC family transcriptional regulator [Acinetobacter nosocomialis]MDR9532557.1 Lrp/AsnC family transcriptional regulator [Acinetobacter nosocomialis]OUT28160.1 Putative transcriptional regulator [Acinetobacter nosocomialis P020]PSE18357.1 Lrp/AsnC family transcriptional regulator [Acinetobacter nosocomialis]